MDKKTFFLSSLKFGAYMGGAYILYSMLIYVLDINPFNIMFSLVTFLITFLIISIFLTMGGKLYRNIYLNGEITYGHAYMFMIFVGIFAAIFVGIYELIYSYTVDLSYLQPKIDEFITKLEDMGNVPEEKLQEIIDKTQKAITMPPYKRALNGMGSILIFSTVISLIVSIFVKKQKEVIEEDEF